MSIHEAIKARRTALGWSQMRLAGEVSKLENLDPPLTYATVQQWENGKSAPKRTRLKFVAQALGCEIGDLTGDAAPSPNATLDWRTLALMIADQCPDPMTREAWTFFCQAVDDEFAKLSRKQKVREISHTP